MKLNIEKVTNYLNENYKSNDNQSEPVISGIDQEGNYTVTVDLLKDGEVINTTISNLSITPEEAKTHKLF